MSKGVTLSEFFNARYWIWQSSSDAWNELEGKVANASAVISGYLGPRDTSESEQYEDLSWQEKVDLYLSSHPEDAWLQTDKGGDGPGGRRHTNSYPLGSAKSELSSDAQTALSGMVADMESDSRFINATRPAIFGLHPRDTTGSGEGGIEDLDPDIRTGMVWDPLNTEAIKFDIYDVAIKGFLPARRPGRGGFLQAHPERYSTIRVLNSRGEPIYATTNFTLESIHKPQKERLSPQVTFDEVIARFGPERMKVFSFSGKLLDYKNFDWMREWERVWDEFLRGEVLARNLWRAYVLSEGNLYGGYMISTNIQKSIQGPGVPFSFTMLMTDNIHLPTLSLVTAQDEARLEGMGASFKGSPEDFEAAMQKLDNDLQKGFPTITKNKGPIESRGEKPTSVYGGDE